MKLYAGGADRRNRRVPVMAWVLVLLVVAVANLSPTTDAWAAAAAPQAAAEPQARAAGVNPRSDYWREVRDAEPGYTTARGPEANVLIQSRGESWRRLRNGPVKIVGAVMALGVIAALLTYHLLTGGARLEHRTGRKLLRWAVSDRVLHWYTAVLFVILAVTGLSLLWGSNVLIPVVGKQAFAAWAAVAKLAHDYLALPFVAGLVVMLVKWFHHSVPARYDLEWLKKAGGYLGGAHPPAGFSNAGEKMFYWTLVVAGAALVVSGFYLLFPNFGFDRATMQNADIVHAVSGLILTTFVLLHIYLGTIGSEGAFEGMVTGEVDEGWARQHHSVWLEELQQGASAPRAPPVRPIGDTPTRAGG
jgi:formate dehydrogenase subunit gamma